MKLTPISAALANAGLRAPAFAHRMTHGSPRVIARDQRSLWLVAEHGMYYQRPGVIQMPTLPKGKT